MPQSTLILAANELVAGAGFEIGPLSLSQEEIIRFAEVADPQRIHTDPEYAATSRFGGIIASGLHTYIAFHIRYWVPMNRRHFICGLSFDGSQFFLPVYPDMPIYSRLEITRNECKPEKNGNIVSWEWNFRDKDARPLCVARFTTYHQLSDRDEK